MATKPPTSKYCWYLLVYLKISYSIPLFHPPGPRHVPGSAAEDQIAFEPSGDHVLGFTTHIRARKIGRAADRLQFKSNLCCKCMQMYGDLHSHMLKKREILPAFRSLGGYMLVNIPWSIWD